MVTFIDVNTDSMIKLYKYKFTKDKSMKIKYILFIIIALLLTGTTAYADTVPNAITFPTVIDDMTVVNLREGPSTGTEKLGSVEMYSNIYVNG